MKLEKARELANQESIKEDEMLQYMKEHKRCEISSCKTRMISNYHPHRIKSGGAGGKYEKSNMIRLCPYHHSEVHSIGNKAFAFKYGIRKIVQKLYECGLWTVQDDYDFSKKHRGKL
jgi:hypothetical protein